MFTIFTRTATRTYQSPQWILPQKEEASVVILVYTEIDNVVKSNC